MSEQIELFGEDKKPITAKQIAEKKEEARLEKLCVVCKEKNKTWDIDDNIKQMCDNCAIDFYNKKFEELNVINGFRIEEEIYVIYSQTTGIEEIRKDRILAVIDGFFGNDIFKYSIQTCDEFGCFQNCLGITEEFAEYLIKKLELEKEIMSSCTTFKSDNTTEEQISHEWINKKIIPNENAKKIAEKNKELAKKKEEMMTTINEIKELEK